MLLLRALAVALIAAVSSPAVYADSAFADLQKTVLESHLSEESVRGLCSPFLRLCKGVCFQDAACKNSCSKRYDECLELADKIHQAELDRSIPLPLARTTAEASLNGVDMNADAMSAAAVEFTEKIANLKSDSRQSPDTDPMRELFAAIGNTADYASDSSSSSGSSSSEYTSSGNSDDVKSTFDFRNHHADEANERFDDVSFNERLDSNGLDAHYPYDVQKDTDQLLHTRLTQPMDDDKMSATDMKMNARRTLVDTENLFAETIDKTRDGNVRFGKDAQLVIDSEIKGIRKYIENLQFDLNSMRRDSESLFLMVGAAAGIALLISALILLVGCFALCHLCCKQYIKSNRIVNGKPTFSAAVPAQLRRLAEPAIDEELLTA